MLYFVDIYFWFWTILFSPLTKKTLNILKGSLKGKMNILKTNSFHHIHMEDPKTVANIIKHFVLTHKSHLWEIYVEYTFVQDYFVNVKKLSTIFLIVSETDLRFCLGGGWRLYFYFYFFIVTFLENRAKFKNMQFV